MNTISGPMTRGSLLFQMFDFTILISIQFHQPPPLLPFPMPHLPMNEMDGERNDTFDCFLHINTGLTG